MHFGKIICLSPINGEIVTFPWLVIECDQLPFARSNSAVALVFEEECTIVTVAADLSDQVGSRQR